MGSKLSRRKSATTYNVLNEAHGNETMSGHSLAMVGDQTVIAPNRQEPKDDIPFETAKFSSSGSSLSVHGLSSRSSHLSHTSISQEIRLCQTPGYLTSKPCQARCRKCLQLVSTNVLPVFKDEAYLMAFLLCFFCGIISCFIPFVIDSFKEYRHYCPNCKCHIGTYNVAKSNV
ncbi:unnamed protein product [Clavelina lepadiformis]|uniref:LITAF domain-containing protein n=1 Tax=Clavelina lepadiformis TaxID=159417 RepID=A0ABP0GG13_CLALP